MSFKSNPGVHWSCFTLLCDWSKKLHHPLNQSDTQPKPITAWSPAFSRALGSLPAFALSPDWLLSVFSFLLIGRYDYLGSNLQGTKTPQK